MVAITTFRCAPLGIRLAMECGAEKEPSSSLSTSGDCSSAGSTAVEKYWWHVNKGGIPVVEATWEKMWDYVVATHPEGESVAASIRGKACKKVPIPPPPVVSLAYSTHDNLLRVQKYLEELQYNHTGTQFFDIKKTRPLSR